MNRAWVFYDGSCGLCHRAVRFAVTRDRDGSRFRFAPLGGVSAERELGEKGPLVLPDSVVVLTASGEVKLRSDAALYLLRRLKGPWRVLGIVLSVVPRPLRDLVYRLIAALRRRLFPPPDGPCPVVPPEFRARFDP